jgi:ceramide kinase
MKGGDGFFNEVLNGILLSRHKAPYPPTPPDFVHSTSNDDDNNNLAQDSHRTFAQLVDSDEFPLLFSSTSNNMSPLPNSSMYMLVFKRKLYTVIQL